MSHASCQELSFDDRVKLLGEMEAAAHQAARILLEGFRRAVTVEHKGSIDLVTEFDRRSEECVREALQRRTGLPVVGEEASAAFEGAGGSTGPEARDSAGRAARGTAGGWAAAGAHRFFVDPLDGTTNFVHGHPYFCVSIGLVAGDVPVAGCVVAPAMGLKWMGTWEGFDPAQPGTRRFATRNDAPCAVSATTDLVSAMLATGFPYDVHSSADDNLLSFATLLKRVRAIRRCGAAAMDLCHVAEGTFDAYWERKLKPWDLAAGAAIVIAAGGRVTAMDGAPLGGHGHSRGRPLLHHGHTLASNGRLHALVTEALAGTFPADDVSESLP